jgi:hypothetical protein
MDNVPAFALFVMKAGQFGKRGRVNMVRYGLLLVAFLGATGSVLASSWADNLFDEHSRDFGNVPRGPLQSHPFRLVNRTKETIHISSVRVSCGCTSARVLQTTLAPGEETAILAQMDTRRFFGSKGVTIYVQFDQPAFEEVRLWVQANSHDDLAMVPESLAFGQILKGASPSSSVIVSLLGNDQWQIVKAGCDSNYIIIDYKQASRNGSEVSYQVSARIRPDTPVGKWFTDIWVNTNDPGMPRLRIPLTVEVNNPSPPTILPPKEGPRKTGLPTIALGLVKAGTESERKIILRGPRPFKITEIDGMDSQVRIHDSKGESRKVHVLTITVRPEAAGQIENTIHIHTDLTTGSEIQFTTRAQVIP